MRKTFQYRITPTKAQISIMLKILEECRWVYNQTLAYRKDVWEHRKESVNLYQTSKLLPMWKQERPSLTMVYSQTLQNVQERIDLAFKAFFRRVKTGEKPGYPRFRGKGRYDSFSYPQFGFSLENGNLKVAKIGTIRINLHRPVQGKIKTLTIRRHSTDKWYASFSAEVDCQPLPKTDKVVGIDVGLETFATLSNGDKVANPRFFRRDEKELVKAQRKLSSTEKETAARVSRRKVVSRIHERIANRRGNFAHQLSRKLVNEYGIIAFEKLNIDRMLKNHRLAKSIADASWNQLVCFTTYKAACADRQVVLVDPKNTSKRCSRCGSMVDKPLSERTHSCPFCGLVIDRDYNASINILSLGLQAVGSIPKSPTL